MLTKDHFIILSGILFLVGIPLVLLGWTALALAVVLASFTIGGSVFCWVSFERVSSMLKVPAYRNLFILYHIIILFVSVIPVRGWVTTVMGMPAADFSTTTYLLPVLIYPLPWALTIVLFLVIMMMIFNARSGLHLMRGNQETASQRVKAIGLFVGAFSTCAVVATIGILYGALMLGASSVKWMAYLCDYHLIAHYPGIDHRTPALLHDNGVVSYATIDDRLSVTITVSRVGDQPTARLPQSPAPR